MLQERPPSLTSTRASWCRAVPKTTQSAEARLPITTWFQATRAGRHRLPGNRHLGNVAQGNWTGLNAAGTGTIANQAGIAFIDGASGDYAFDNVVSGNSLAGIAIINYDSSTGSSDNLVQGNLIGTDPTGVVALGNSDPGVVIYATSTGNTIGGTNAAARNIISANASAGVSITGTGTAETSLLVITSARTRPARRHWAIVATA